MGANRRQKRSESFGAVFYPNRVLPGEDRRCTIQPLMKLRRRDIWRLGRILIGPACLPALFHQQFAIHYILPSQLDQNLSCCSCIAVS